MPIHIVRGPVSLDELRRIAAPQFGDFVKAVVDVSRGVINVRPSRSNRSRGVEDAEVRQRIQEIAARLVVP